MAAQKRFLIETQFNLVCFGCVNRFLCREMVLFGGSFWVSVCALLVALFGFINRMFFRVQVRESNCLTLLPQDMTLVQEQPETEEAKSDSVSVSEEEKEEEPKFFSKFQFRRYEEFIGSNGGKGDSVISTETCSSSSSSNKYEFLSGKAFGVFLENPEDVSFTVQELHTDNDFKKQSSDTDNDFEKQSSEAVFEETPENPKESEAVEVHKIMDFSGFRHLIDSSNDGFLSEGDFVSSEAVNQDLELLAESSSIGHESQEDAQDKDMLSENDFHNDNNDSKDDDFDDSSCNKVVQDCEDSTGFESLWEHQDLIEQLKMELKKVRATGLPTILEESECPKIMEDLKPWKIEEKFQRHDTMGELHKFYKSYRERMRKFDILNYQKMYAIGFLQSKDPLKTISISRSSIPVIGSLLSESFRLCKRKKLESDRMIKFMRELHSDLETVYVGQLCLSWEFLHWQYEKTLELWESDVHGFHRYNEVAGEFQQFQVLMQRFIENELFEGPRVQNYVKNRCVLRNLLQVPVVREDSFKDKRRARSGKGDYVITSDMLVEIMEESIRIFWRFLRADKDANNGMQIVRKENQVEVQDPGDKKLFMELKTDLQKKEKKLKDLLRSGNCILRRFQKQHQEESSEQVLYFFSQVDMKLVSRVLNMSRITSDQLLWCHNKLSNINFVNRKINVESSFLLFPC